MQENNCQQPITTAYERTKSLYHTRVLSPNQCSSIVTRAIHAPLSLVWSLVRDFKNPRAYKMFVSSCELSSGEGGAGSVRKVTVVTGLPARNSVERLERLDDESHVMVVSITGGDHMLKNYTSIITLHEDDDDSKKERWSGFKTIVMESYVVDTSEENCPGDTCVFVDTVIGFNQKSLAETTEKMVLCE